VFLVAGLVLIGMGGGHTGGQEHVLMPDPSPDTSEQTSSEPPASDESPFPMPELDIAERSEDFADQESRRG
jgi:hypothetical protein